MPHPSRIATAILFIIMAMESCIYATIHGHTPSSLPNQIPRFSLPAHAGKAGEEPLNLERLWKRLEKVHAHVSNLPENADRIEIQVKPRPNFYVYALAEISYWLDALVCRENHIVTERLARDALRRLWGAFDIHGRAEDVLAARLTDEYMIIFNPLTQVYQDKDISRREVELKARFGAGALVYGAQIPLRYPNIGFDWDFAKYRRGLLWEGAKVALSPKPVGTVAHAIRKLSRKGHTDLIEGLTNCIVQISQGQRGSAILDRSVTQSLIHILRTLSDAYTVYALTFISNNAPPLSPGTADNTLPTSASLGKFPPDILDLGDWGLPSGKMDDELLMDDSSPPGVFDPADWGISSGKMDDQLLEYDLLGSFPPEVLDPADWGIFPTQTEGTDVENLRKGSAKGHASSDEDMESSGSGDDMEVE